MALGKRNIPFPCQVSDGHEPVPGHDREKDGNQAIGKEAALIRDSQPCGMEEGKDRHTHTDNCFDTAKSESGETKTASEADVDKSREAAEGAEGGSKEDVPEKAMEGERKKLGTFLVRILGHEKNNWQGSIQWKEQNRTVCFRGTMEMLMLMNQAIEEFSPVKWEGHKK